MSIDTTGHVPAPSPHPLARALARIVTESGARVLMLGYGSGRNLAAFAHPDVTIDVVETEERRRAAALARTGSDEKRRVFRDATETIGPYAGALATNDLLHGTPATIAVRVALVRERLRANAPFYLTLGSKRDPRFGRGTPVGVDSFAPDDGSEAGVAHAYFDERGVRALFASFTLESIEEADAGESAGAWAHTPAERATLRHWFVRARVAGG